MKTILSIIIASYFLFFMILGCANPIKHSLNNITWAKRKGSFNIKIIGWTGYSNHKFAYEISHKPTRINGNIYYKFEMGVKQKTKDLNGFLRFSQDTIYWLDATFKDADAYYERFRKEQIFLCFKQNNNKLPLYTYSTLLDSSYVTLENINISGDRRERIYLFKFETINRSPNYFLPPRTLYIGISSKKGFLCIIFEEYNENTIGFFK